MNNYLIRSRNDKIIGIMCWQFLMSSKAGHNAPVFEKYQQKAKNFMCSCLAKGDRNTQKTPGGLICRQRWNNMYFVTSAAFLGTTYSDYLASAGKYLKCSSGSVSPNELLSFSNSQVKILTLIECYKPVL